VHANSYAPSGVSPTQVVGQPQRKISILLLYKFRGRARTLTPKPLLTQVVGRDSSMSTNVSSSNRDDIVLAPTSANPGRRPGASLRFNQVARSNSPVGLVREPRGGVV
jgi:hypothetical protein